MSIPQVDDLRGGGGREINVDIGEDTTIDTKKLIRQLGQMKISANEKAVERSTIVTEEEVNNRIWEEIDEKYELREETKIAMQILGVSTTYSDLGQVYIALTKRVFPRHDLFLLITFYRSWVSVFVGLVEMGTRPSPTANLANLIVDNPTRQR